MSGCCMHVNTSSFNLVFTLEAGRQRRAALIPDPPSPMVINNRVPTTPTTTAVKIIIERHRPDPRRNKVTRAGSRHYYFINMTF